MSARIRRGRTLARIALAMLTAGVLTTLFHLYSVPAVVWLAERNLGPAAGADSLADLAVSIQAQPIAGLSHNLSGLTYSTATSTLFAVINRPPALAELNTEGMLLRVVPLPGLQDPEGITHVDGDTFLISGEANHTLHRVKLAPGARAAKLAPAADLQLDFRSWHNLGLEGISWDESHSELLLVNEKFPKRVLRVDGLRPLRADHAPAYPIVRPWRSSGWLGVPGNDLASVTAHASGSRLLLLSESSALISDHDRSGQLLGLLPLWAGKHGLRHRVPQPEGLAMGPDGTIYVVSEPNLFYRFSRSTAATPEASG